MLKTKCLNLCTCKQILRYFNIGSYIDSKKRLCRCKRFINTFCRYQHRSLIFFTFPKSLLLGEQGSLREIDSSRPFRIFYDLASPVRPTQVLLAMISEFSLQPINMESAVCHLYSFYTYKLGDTFTVNLVSIQRFQS